MPHPFREAEDSTNELVCTDSVVPAPAGTCPRPTEYLHQIGRARKKRRLRDAHLRSLRLYPLCPGQNTPKTAHDGRFRRAGPDGTLVLQSLYSNNTFTTLIDRFTSLRIHALRL